MAWDDDPYAGSTLDSYASTAPGPLYNATPTGTTSSATGNPMFNLTQTSWSDKLGSVGGALKDLSGSVKGLGGSGGDASAARYPTLPNAPSPPGSRGIGQPTAPVSLQQLMQLLMQRRNAYLQASNPLSAKPVTEPLPAGSGGLLGI